MLKRVCGHIQDLPKGVCHTEVPQLQTPDGSLMAKPPETTRIFQFDTIKFTNCMIVFKYGTNLPRQTPKASQQLWDNDTQL